MIRRCIACHLTYVDQEKLAGLPPLCGDCIQKAEIKTTQQNPGPPSIANSMDMLTALERTFKKMFGEA